jgi:subtilase family serine protease
LISRLVGLRAIALMVVSCFSISLSTAQQSAQVLHKHVRPEISRGRLTAVGIVAPDRELNLIVHLPLRNETELRLLIARLSDPKNSEYRQWLSVGQFTERFGRTEAEYAKALDFLESNGLTVTYKSPNRLLMAVKAPVTTIEKTFNVNLRTYRHPSGNRLFYAPDREPSVALDVPVSHVSGLNNFSYPQPASRRGQVGSSLPASPTNGSGPGSWFLGSDMRAAYNMGTNTGQGQAVGLMEFSGYTASDVSLYFSSVNQSNTVPVNDILVGGASAAAWSNSNWEAEVCLDIDQVVSIAPGLDQLRVYIGPANFGSGVDGLILSRMATDNIAKQLSNSWWWYPDDPATDDPYFMEMAAQGQTFFNISGDDGAYTGYSYNDMGYPAEDDHVTVVGGTHLSTTVAGGPWQSEVAWTESGGGPADDGVAYFPIANWQVAVINSSNGGSTVLRNSPDVALEADFDNYICFDGGACEGGWGGTSFASPRWAAWLALVNQQLVSNGKPAGLGFLNPTLYVIGQSTDYENDFHDVSEGNNGQGGTHSYNAVSGYDLVTGWGSMNGLSLMAALGGKITPDITWTSPSSISYGTLLSGSQLNAEANVVGSFVYSPPAGTLLTVGSHSLSVTFTPTDQTVYKIATATASVRVTKATPVITWANPPSISYGTRISSIQLNAQANASGTFVYSPPAGTLLSVGSHSLSVTFTPTDQINFNNAAASASLLVVKAAPVITWATPGAIGYGTKLSRAQLDAKANVAGAFTYNPAVGAELNTGTHTLSATFQPSDSADYSPTSRSVPITVKKAIPILTWPTPAPIKKGTKLSGKQLDCKASISGTFAYTPGIGSLLTKGPHTLSTTFTPSTSNAVNYTKASKSVSIKVE